MVASPQVDNYDPFEAAEKATGPTGGVFFGKLEVKVWPVVLVKGDPAKGIKGGKLDFDPNLHSYDQRVTALRFTLVPLTRGDAPDYKIERECIAESREWTKIIRPSIHEVGADIRNLSGRYAQIKLVPTGKKYTDRKTGEEKDSTTITLVELYPDEAACRKAAAEYFGADDDGRDAADAHSNGTNGDVAANTGEREAAKAFIAPLWNAAGHDIGKFRELIRANSMVAKHFNLASPEVVAVTGYVPDPNSPDATPSPS